MKKYKELFKRDSANKVRVWYMESEGNKYRTVSGLTDGDKVTSEWTIVLGKNHGKKNETSDFDQTEKEIEAKYKKQLKSGYFDDISKIDNESYFKPMLAKNYKDYAHKIDLTSGEYLLQTKFNGIRCIATINGLFTRKGERILTCPHIERSLDKFFINNPKAILDGELFNFKLKQNLNEINSIIRKTVNISDEDIQKSKELIQYHVYDGFGFGLGKECCYRLRKHIIDQICESKDYLEVVYDYTINSKEDLDRIYNTFIDQGHEGGILRLKESAYESKRSKNLLKIKPEDDSEAIILNISEGEGNWSGAGKVITLNWNGIIFDASFKGSYSESAEFLRNKGSWIGKTVTFLYNGLTGLGTPNFARVDINNCLK
jgi:DNA ligase-1